MPALLFLNPLRFYSHIAEKWMNFYWKEKKNQVSHLCVLYLYLVPTKLSQLYARRGTIPAVDDIMVDPWTIFQMTLREPGPIPSAFDFTRFLVSSITFMTHLSEVSVYLDDKRLVKLSKDRGRIKEVSMLEGLKCTSPQGMMNVKAIETMREFRSGKKRRLYLELFLDSHSDKSGSGPMGVQCRFRKALRYIEDSCPKDRDD